MSNHGNDPALDGEAPAIEADLERQFSVLYGELKNRVLEREHLLFGIFCLLIVAGTCLIVAGFIAGSALALPLGAILLLWATPLLIGLVRLRSQSEHLHSIGDSLLQTTGAERERRVSQFIHLIAGQS
jgi:hypothetical protein